MTSIVYLSLGSNIDRERNIRAAVEQLKIRFSKVELSPVYESEAVGFDGDSFFNLIARIETSLPLSELSASLKALENELGRDRSTKRFASRTMDIDIVLFDDLVGSYAAIELPRPELFYNAFVLKPMADLIPEAVEPKTKTKFAELYAQLKTDQRLWKVALTF
jgi:2-amino-4-hydroxy-6-hydroxymethyldihydropteridine diphosphokinase